MSRVSSTIGPKVRVLRRQKGMSQVALADRLGISPSYLNLIEHNRRAMPAALLFKVAEIFELDLKALSTEHDARTVADLMELFGDAIFENEDVTTAEVRDLVAHAPAAARGILKMYHAYREAREAAASLAIKISGRSDLTGVDASRMPTEEVSDLIQRHSNHFPEIEEGAERLLRDTRLGGDDLQQGLEEQLERVHGIQVRIERPADMGDAIRRFDPERRVLHLSESLRRGSRNFHLAYQVGLETQQAALDRHAADPMLTSDAARALARVLLANYFASAVLMPYATFLEAARRERYDIDLLGNHFRTSYEQVCHRLTTLRRPGAEGIPMHFVRVDVAGNISKRFSASGLRFARFSGACPRWNVFQAFLTPGMIRTQVSQMPDGTTYFWVARSVYKEGGGYHAPRTPLAIAIGCEVGHARKMVYADGMDLESREAVVPVGLTCRLCERTDCEQRAFPPIQHPLAVEENVRGISFFAPVDKA